MQENHPINVRDVKWTSMLTTPKDIAYALIHHGAHIVKHASFAAA